MNSNNYAPANDNSFATVPVNQKALTNVHPEISITIKNGIATLSGTSNSPTDSVQTEQLISQVESVDQIINLITTVPCKNSGRN